MKKNARTLEVIAIVILLIGGINWGLIGLFEWNFLASAFGYTSVLTRSLYSIIGIAAVFKILTWSTKTR